MRRVVPYLIFLCLFGAFSSGCSKFDLEKITEPPPPSQVIVFPASHSVQEGDTYEVAIKVEELSNVFGYNIYLSFNPEVVEMESASKGNFLGGSSTDLFISYKEPGQSSGILIISQSHTDGQTSSGSGELCRIIFKAKSSGSNELLFNEGNSISLFEDLKGEKVIVDEWIDSSALPASLAKK